MRLITAHIVVGDSVNQQVQIAATDEPGAGGANHEYQISWQGPHCDGINISFQNGPIKENGVNGITQEALIAIVIDRLWSFQAGAFACIANQDAINHFEAGLKILQRRTQERIARGVEGTHSN